MSRRLALPCFALVLTGCAKSTDDWLRDLRDDEPFTRILAAAALGEVGPEDSERAARALVELRYDTPEVFEHAERALLKLARRDPALFVRLVDEPRYEKDRWCVLEPLVAVGQSAVPLLLAALREGEPSAHGGVARVLGRLGKVDELVAWAKERGGDALAIAAAGCKAAGEKGKAAKEELERAR